VENRQVVPIPYSHLTPSLGSDSFEFRGEPDFVKETIESSGCPSVK